jgi:hypothetical protein
VASFLVKQGYRAFALRGGYLAWFKAGYPIERKEATAHIGDSGLRKKPVNTSTSRQASISTQLL